MKCQMCSIKTLNVDWTFGRVAVLGYLRYFCMTLCSSNTWSLWAAEVLPNLQTSHCFSGQCQTFPLSCCQEDVYVQFLGVNNVLKRFPTLIRRYCNDIFGCDSIGLCFLPPAGPFPHMQRRLHGCAMHARVPPALIVLTRPHTHLQTRRGVDGWLMPSIFTFIAN